MPPTCRCGIEAYLPLDITCGAEFESSDIACESEGVGARGCEEVFPAVGEDDDVGAVRFRVWDTWCCVSVLILVLEGLDGESGYLGE